MPDHLHLARFTTPEGDTFERVFVLDTESQVLGGETAAVPPATHFRDYLNLGVEHIATGFDHLLFLLALLLAGIGLAALGAWAGKLAVPVVAVIGVGLFACGYLGLLERAERLARMRWFVAFVFGLIHGFGFAGLLTDVGLPPGRLAAALLGFNLGVEAGQLVLVALAWPLLYLALRGGPERRAWVAQLGSTPVLIAGLYWFLTRSLG